MNKEPQNLPHLHSYRVPDRCSGGVGCIAPGLSDYQPTVAAHWMCTLRGKRGTKSRGGPGNQTEGVYEDVDGGQPLTATRDVVSLKRNEAYGNISTQSTTTGSNTAL